MVKVADVVTVPESEQVKVAVYVVTTVSLLGFPLMTPTVPLVETESPVLVDRSGMAILYAVQPVTLGVTLDVKSRPTVKTPLTKVAAGVPVM